MILKWCVVSCYLMVLLVHCLIQDSHFVLFQQTDKPWHKCPICYEAVHKKALKRFVNVTRGQALVTCQYSCTKQSWISWRLPCHWCTNIGEKLRIVKKIVNHGNLTLHGPSTCQTCIGGIHVSYPMLPSERSGLRVKSMLSKGKTWGQIGRASCRERV